MADDYTDADAIKLAIKAANATSYEVALSIYNQLVERSPNKYVGQRARFFEKAEQFEKALEDYNLAATLDPNAWLPFRATYLAQCGEKMQALADYESLIEIRCNSSSTALANAYCMRARFYETESQFDLAEQDYEKATQIDEIYLRTYAAFCQKNDLLDKYFQSLNRLVLTMPETYLGLRANYFERHRNFDEAIVDYDEWVRVSRLIGFKEGYSPRAWALRCRANFFKRRGELMKFYRDSCTAELYVAIQSVVGFSGWPRGEDANRCYDGN